MVSVSDIQTISPCSAYWLANTGNNDLNVCFDITDPNTYPFEVGYDFDQEVRRLIYKVHYKEVRLKCIMDDSYYALDKLVQFVRDHVRDKFDLEKKMPVRVPLMRIANPGPIPKSLLQKRLFFLYIAKQVAHGLTTPGEAARQYGIDKVNIWIWTNIYLNYGEDSFFRSEPTFTPEKEEEIIRKHYENKYTVAYTCSRIRLFSRTRLKNMRLRVLRRTKRPTSSSP